MEEGKERCVGESGIGSETGEREKTEERMRHEIGRELAARGGRVEIKERQKERRGAVEGYLLVFFPRFNPILRLTFKSTNV